MRKPLPPHLRHGPFSLREALTAGVSDRSLRSPELARPFHGVRIVASEAITPLQRIRSYQRRMPAAQYFSHVTAAIAHQFPLPLLHELDPNIHVGAAPGAGLPRARGVIGHRSRENRPLVTRAGCRVTSAIATWCDLATVLELDDLIAIGDFLVTGDEPYSNVPPIASLQELTDAVRARSGRRGIRKLTLALDEVRYGAVSRMETLTRLLVTRSGLPEPALNHVITDPSGAFVAMVDLAFVAEKVAVEYQGEHHREKARFRRDITRRERIEDVGWGMIYVAVDDVVKNHTETLRRIRSRLRARGADI